MGIWGVNFWFWGNHNWSTKGHLFEELPWTCTKNPSTSIFMKDAPGKDEWIKGLWFCWTLNMLGRLIWELPYNGSFLGGAFGGSKMLSLWGWTPHGFGTIGRIWSIRTPKENFQPTQKQQRCLTNQKTIQLFRNLDISPPQNTQPFSPREQPEQKDMTTIWVKTCCYSFCARLPASTTAPWSGKPYLWSQLVQTKGGQILWASFPAWWCFCWGEVPPFGCIKPCK